MTNSEFLISRDGVTKEGPIPLDVLRDRLASGEVPTDVLVWRAGMNQWTVALNVPELVDFVPPPLPRTNPLPGVRPPTRPSDYVEYAGFWLRAVAFVIDQFVLAIPALFLEVVVAAAFYADVYDEGPVAVTQLFVLVVLFWLYYAVMENSPLQATVGKLALGLRVTTTEGQRPGFGRATARHFAKFISALILLVGFVVAAFTTRKQALHDIVAECLVIRASSRIQPRQAQSPQREAVVRQSVQEANRHDAAEPNPMTNTDRTGRRWGVFFAVLLVGGFIGVVAIAIIQEAHPDGAVAGPWLFAILAIGLLAAARKLSESRVP